MGNTELVLIGYFLRRTTRAQDWPMPAVVQEVCSVSDCMNPSPGDWIDRWLHNELGLFNTCEDARTMAVDKPEEYRLFAYRLLPVCFSKPGHEPVSLLDLAIFPHPGGLATRGMEPLPKDFASLGFDVVSRSQSSYFECSPLSCNGLANEVPVNRYCLLDTLEAAEPFAERCGREEPEPGPYFVLEVLREGG